MTNVLVQDYHRCFYAFFLASASSHLPPHTDDLSDKCTDQVIATQTQNYWQFVRNLVISL